MNYLPFFKGCYLHGEPELCPGTCLTDLNQRALPVSSGAQRVARVRVRSGQRAPSRRWRLQKPHLVDGRVFAGQECLCFAVELTASLLRSIYMKEVQGESLLYLHSLPTLTTRITRVLFTATACVKRFNNRNTEKSGNREYKLVQRGESGPESPIGAVYRSISTAARNHHRVKRMQPRPAPHRA